MGGITPNDINSTNKADLLKIHLYSTTTTTTTTTTMTTTTTTMTAATTTTTNSQTTISICEYFNEHAVIMLIATSEKGKYKDSL